LCHVGGTENLSYFLPPLVTFIIGGGVGWFLKARNAATTNISGSGTGDDVTNSSSSSLSSGKSEGKQAADGDDKVRGEAKMAEPTPSRRIK
jgi:hypothetical protein